MNNRSQPIVDFLFTWNIGQKDLLLVSLVQSSNNLFCWKAASLWTQTYFCSSLLFREKVKRRPDIRLHLQAIRLFSMQPIWSLEKKQQQLAEVLQVNSKNVRSWFLWCLARDNFYYIVQRKVNDLKQVVWHKSFQRSPRLYKQAENKLD